jgi:predicted nuclease with TOPRIM domain
MNFKEQEDIILRLKGEKIELNEKYLKLKEEYNELFKKYVNLRAKYTNQNDELLKLRLFIYEEGHNENKH